MNCPGNFANIYREYNGDASALTEIYFDRDSKEITGAAVIPMWTQSQLSGNYRALPIYDILHDTQLRAELSTYDLERVEQVQQHITEIMLGCNVPCSAAERRYFITDSGYMAQPAEPVALTEEEKASPLYQKLSEAESVCFVGDSITHGTKNGGFGWYRPLESLLNNVTECAAGGSDDQEHTSRSADRERHVCGGSRHERHTLLRRGYLRNDRGGLHSRAGEVRAAGKKRKQRRGIRLYSAVDVA